MKLIRAIVHLARRQPQEPAVAFGGGIASFGALMGATSAVAEALKLLPLPRGGLVVLDIRNPIHHVAAIYALALLGIRSASVNAAYTAQQSGPKPDLFLTDLDDLPATDLPTRRVDARWFAFDANAPVDYEALLALPGFPDAEDVVRYVYSSGTTGRPKCVALTNRILEHRLADAHLSIPQRIVGGAAINLMGFSTIAGITAPLLAHTVGFLLCFSSSAAETLHMTRLFGITAIAGAVVQLQAIMQALGPNPPPPSLRGVVVAGSKLPPSIRTEIRSRLASFVIANYGSTEMGSVTAGAPGDLERHEGAAGHVLPWVTLETVDDEQRPVPRGVEGVIRVKTPDLAFYVDDQGRPAETTQDGWFYPGDVGRIEPDGLVIITGRTGEVINRGGVIVAPDLIEEVLRLDPHVGDVAVVGSPNAAGIDEIWAGIVSSSPIDGERLLKAARAKLNERVPDRLFQIDAVPRNENGKVMRNVLRETMRRMLGA